MANIRRNIPVGAVTIAADLETSICRAPFAGVLIGAFYTARAAVAGAASPNSRTWTVFNRGQAGAGVAAMATLPCIDAGSSCVALAAKPLNLGTVALRTFAEGDVLSWNSAAVTGAGGLVDPGGMVELVLQPSLR